MILEHEDPAFDGPPEDEPFALGPTTTLRRARRKGRRRKLLRFALGAAGICVTALLAVAGGGALYLRNGQISLDQLQPEIAANLQSRLQPGYRVALGPVAIARSGHGVGIVFSGLAIHDGEGRTVLGAPTGRISLDALALLRLDVKVRRLELDGLQLTLRVGPNGELSLAAAGDNAAPISLGGKPSGPLSTNPGALVAGLAHAVVGADQPLDHVAILDGRLTVENAGRDAPAVYDELQLAFDRSGDSAGVSLSAHGPAGRWRVEAHAEQGAKRKLAVEAHDLSAEDFTRLDPHPPGFSFDSPISFRLTAEATPAGALTALDGSFSLGAGSFDPHDPDGGAPVVFDEATGRIALDGDGNFAIEKLEALAGATHLRFAGALTPPGADPNWRLALRSSDIVIAATGDNAPPARLDDVDLKAHFDPAATLFAIDKLAMHGPQLAGDLAAEVRKDGDGVAVKLDVSGSGAIVEALNLWPVYLNPDARKWCVENIRGGDLASGSIKVDWDGKAFAAVLAKQAAPADSVDGRFTLHAAAADLLPGLPTTTGLDAVGRITGRTFQVSAPRGVMELGNGRRLNGTDLGFNVPDTAPAARVAANGAGHVTGSADSLAELLTRDALKRYVGVALDPSTIAGQFQADLKLDLTLGKGVQPEEQKFRVVGALSNLSVEKFLGSAKLEQAAIDFSADRTQVKLTGAGSVFGAPAKLEVSKVGQDVGALVLTQTLDEAARAKLGFNNGPRLRGPVALKLKAPLDKSGADVEVDLAKATLDSPGGGPLKPAGRPGKATFQLKASPDGVQVNNLAIDAGALAAHGTALFATDGGLKSLKLSPFKMSPSDDLKLEVEGGATAKLTVRGSSMDARSLVKGITGGEGERATGDLDIDVKVASASGYNREAIAPLEFTGQRRNGAFSAIDAHGRIGQASVSARSGEAGAIVVKSDDAGALSRFLDLYGKLEGGSIDLTVRPGTDATRGVATIKKFSIRDEDSLKQLEQASPAPLSSARGSTLSSNGDPSPPVRFERATASFTRTGGKLDIKDAVVSNASFGLTANGFIDFGHDKVDVNGVYVPLYGVNNALGQIPLLGTLLAGGQNEGVFAINYRVTGTAAHPTLNVNPLSGMTPGLLRKMFGAIDGTTPPAAAGDDAPSSFAPLSQPR